MNGEPTPDWVPSKEPIERGSIFSQLLKLFPRLKFEALVLSSAGDCLTG